jgi:flagellar assembly protein FliH
MPSSSGALFTPLASPGASAPAGGFRPLGPPIIGGPPVAPMAAEPEAEPDETRRAFQAGYESARQELEGRVDTIAESFVKALEELAAFRSRLRDGYERELLEVALGVARKVVQQELAARPEIWLTMIRDAARRAIDRSRIVVRVPAALAEFLRQRTPELRAALDEVKELEVVEDPSLPLAGCVLETGFGEIDIGVESQIEAARSALVNAEE